MEKEKLKDGIMLLLKWLKILTAVLMFILGLLNEGIHLDPDATPQEIEVANDSILLSLAGFAVTGFCGCPVMYLAGYAVSML